MAIAKYKFEKLPQDVVLPDGASFFISLAEVNEVTGHYGGSLIFTDAQLDQEITFTEWKTKNKVKKPFRQGVEDLIDAYLEEYNSKSKKPAKRVDKFKQATDKDGNIIEGKWEFSCKNKEQPTIVDKDRTKLVNYDTLIANGSTLKCQVSLVPYIMQGKLGVTAYLQYVLLKNVIELDGGNGNPFDDDDFDEDAPDFDEDNEECEATDIATEEESDDDDY